MSCPQTSLDYKKVKVGQTGYSSPVLTLVTVGHNTSACFWKAFPAVCLFQCCHPLPDLPAAWLLIYIVVQGPLGGFFLFNLLLVLLSCTSAKDPSLNQSWKTQVPCWNPVKSADFREHWRVACWGISEPSCSKWEMTSNDVTLKHASCYIYLDLLPIWNPESSTVSFLENEIPRMQWGLGILWEKCNDTYRVCDCQRIVFMFAAFLNHLSST